MRPVRSTLLRHSAISLGVAAAVVACGGPSYDHTDISDVSQGALPATVSLSTVSMTVGGATRAYVKPWDDDDEQMTASVTSDDPDVLDIAPGLDDFEFVFIARKPGTTSARFMANGEVIALAKVTVKPQ